MPSDAGNMRRLWRDLKWVYRYPSVPPRYLSLRKVANYYRSQLSWLCLVEKVRSHPYYITLEPTNICNLECPQCPTGQKKYGRRPSMMPLKRFKTLIDELAPYALMVDLHNWGEPLLYREIFEAIRYCEDQKIMTVMSTNFNVPFDDDRGEKLVASGLSILGVSIDGPDQDSYEKYRRNGRLERVLENVRIVNEAKRRLGSDSPRITWSYLVFRYNQHLIGRAREMAGHYNMEFQATRGISKDETWLTTDFHIHPVDDVSRHGPGCRALYTMAVVNSDLGVSPCCYNTAYDSESDFGSVADRSFAEIWNGADYQTARRLFGNIADRDINSLRPIACTRCVVYAAHKEGADHGRS